MNITIKATNMDLTEEIEEYIRKRLATLEKFSQDAIKDSDCAVEIGKTTEHHKHGDIFRAEIHLYVKPKTLYASSEMTDVYAAIDAVKETVERELISRKGKKIDTIRRIGARIKNILKNTD